MRVVTKRLPLYVPTAIVLGALTLVVLVLNFPEQGALVNNGGILVFYGLLAALTLNFGVIDGELSPAHGIGMLMLLSLPRSAMSASLWMIVLASIVGQLARQARLRAQGHTSLLAATFVVARIALSFYAAALIYGGDLPLTDLTNANLLPVLIYGIGYSAVYFLLFAVETVVAGKTIPREHLSEILLVLLVPILYALLGALILNRLSALAFLIYLVSLSVVLVRRQDLERAQRHQIEALSSTVDNKLYMQQQARASQLATLNSILSLLTDTLSPETVIDTVITSASMITEASAVAIYLYREDALVFSRGAGLSDAFQANPSQPLSAHESRDFQQPIVVGDAAREAPSRRELMVREGKAAWIELPLVFQGVRTGVLVICYDAPREFSDEMIELLRTFANQCAQAIGNARLYEITDEELEQRVGQLLALATIGHHLTATLEVRAICDLVVEYALASTEANAAAIILIDEAGELDQWAASGYPPDLLSENRDLFAEGITGTAMRSRDTVRVSDVSREPDYVALLAETRAQLSTPILWNEGVVGVITLESDHAGAFSEEDSYFVKQLANQAIIAIENARLFRKVAEARDRMQVILNTVKEGLILIGVTGKIVLANPRVELMGLQPEMLINKSLDQLLVDHDLAERFGFRTGSELQRLVKELRAPGGLTPREPKVFTFGEDDPRYIQRQVFPVSDEAGQPVGVLLVFYDETEEVRLAQTREEVSQMLIHDLRSPLTAVTTSLKLLTELTPKDSPIRPVIESTTEAGRRAVGKLLNRVDSLLDVSRMENGAIALETQATELATLVDNVCVELSPLAQELGIVIKPEISDDCPLLEIDADKVERLLLNLADNALKFSPDNSTVTVRAHAPGAEGAAPGFMRIDVIDAGPGVPDEYKLILFDRFVQVRGRTGSRRGTGLGLTFCRLVTETHGGRIWIDDNPGGGSVFAFTLPIVAEQDASGAD